VYGTQLQWYTTGYTTGYTTPSYLPVIYLWKSGCLPLVTEYFNGIYFGTERQVEINF
jgi:hypothetical protein